MWLAAAQRLFRPSCVSASATIVHQPQRLAPQTARLARWTARSATSKRPAITQLCRAQYDDRQQWSPSPPRPRDDTYLANPQQQAGNGVFVLLLINLLIFLADKVLHLPIIKALYLYHASPQWYQVRPQYDSSMSYSAVCGGCSVRRVHQPVPCLTSVMITCMHTNHSFSNMFVSLITVSNMLFLSLVMGAPVNQHVYAPRVWAIRGGRGRRAGTLAHLPHLRLGCVCVCMCTQTTCGQTLFDWRTTQAVPWRPISAAPAAIPCRWVQAVPFSACLRWVCCQN